MPTRAKKFRQKQNLLLAITIIGATFTVVGFFIGIVQRKQLLEELQTTRRPIFF